MYMRKTQALQMGALTLASLGMWIGPAKAQFSENFDTGSATFTVNDPYWLDPAAVNGLILTTDGGNITQDASGSGFFLFEGTGAYNGSPNFPASQDQFYISPTFSVTPNTAYSVSFKLTNEGTFNLASIQAEIGGQLFSPVTATGTFVTDGWQNFVFSWNSGANTSASLILHDLTTAAASNDFGIDEIRVTGPSSVPEPGSMALLLGLGLSGVGFLARRKVGVRPAV